MKQVVAPQNIPTDASFVRRAALVGLSSQHLGLGFRATFGGFPKFGGSHKKDYSIWGSILGSAYLGKLLFSF